MFQPVLEREYSDPAFNKAHLFTVDAHALQHSEEHGPRSKAFHLMRLCWLVTQGGNPSTRRVQRGGRAVHDARQRAYVHFPFLEPLARMFRTPLESPTGCMVGRALRCAPLPGGSRKLSGPALPNHEICGPASRGRLTVVSVLMAKTPQKHAERARAWGQSVWDAWSAHHAWARVQAQQWFERE